MARSLHEVMRGLANSEVRVMAVSPVSSASPGASALPWDAASWIVQPEDTLCGIARRLQREGMPGTTTELVRTLARLNGLSSPDHIEVGQVLTLPSRAGGPATDGDVVSVLERGVQAFAATLRTQVDEQRARLETALLRWVHRVPAERMPAPAADRTPLFRQGDPAWRTERLGVSGEGPTLAQAGCALTACAMALSRIGGAVLTPDALLRHLRASGDSGVRSSTGALPARRSPAGRTPVPERSTALGWTASSTPAGRSCSGWCTTSRAIRASTGSASPVVTRPRGGTPPTIRPPVERRCWRAPAPRWPASTASRSGTPRTVGWSGSAIGRSEGGAFQTRVQGIVGWRPKPQIRPPEGWTSSANHPRAMDPHVDEAREGEQPGPSRPADEPEIAEPLYARTREQLFAQHQLPLATYRVQLHKDFDFAKASAIAPYLARLGVSHLYASPILRAMPGSNHGYDVVDHTQVNPELGGGVGFVSLADTLRGNGLKLVLDTVPNHMGIASGNALWEDVLENGPAALHAHFFDIEWDPVKAELRNKVLLPILGDQYGTVLDRGELRLEYQGGTILLRYFDHRFPLNPRAYQDVLGPGVEQVGGAARRASPGPRGAAEHPHRASGTCPPRGDTTPEKVQERSREKEVLKRRLNALVSSSPVVAEHLRANLERLNGHPNDPRSFDALDRLLERYVPYRLAHWRVAG
jgi:hypothetical protein